MAETKTSFTSRLKRHSPWHLGAGLVSMFMDISSEMIHALLPIYMVTILGTSMLTVGFIEGLAEATASITKIFSGALSDWLGKRKLLAAQRHDHENYCCRELGPCIALITDLPFLN